MKAVKLASYFIIIAFIVALLIVGKPFLVPLFIAVVIWYLINAINQLIRSSDVLKKLLPNWLGLTISAIFIVGFLFLIGQLIGQNINAMVDAAPDYRTKLNTQFNLIVQRLGLNDVKDLDSIISDFNLETYISGALNSLRNIAQNFFLILIYVIFLLVEQNTFTDKLKALKLSRERSLRLNSVLKEINVASRTYLTVKFLASLITGSLSFAVLSLVGVDFALFWAFLIFLLNFIPTIGSIIATVFPSLVALVQFDSLTPFLVVLIGVVGIQLLIGSILEPRLLGNSLNISPMVVILSLVMWGFIWGPVGMLLCVPMTAMMIIVFSQFETTQPIAVLLSKNGKLNTTRIGRRKNPSQNQISSEAR